MTLYTALMRTQFTENGWVIVLPNGEEEEYDFLEQAMGCILVEHPDILTMSVRSMHYFNDDSMGYFKIELEHGADYTANVRDILQGYGKGNDFSIDDTMKMLELERKFADDLTLGEVNMIADIAGVTPNDVLAHIGF